MRIYIAPKSASSAVITMQLGSKNHHRKMTQINAVTQIPPQETQIPTSGSKLHLKRGKIQTFAITKSEDDGIKTQQKAPGRPFWKVAAKKRFLLPCSHTVAP